MTQPKILGQHDISETKRLYVANVVVLLFCIVAMGVGIYFTIGTAYIVWPFVIGVPIVGLLIRNISFFKLWQ